MRLKIILSIFIYLLYSNGVLCQNEVLRCDFICWVPTACNGNLTIFNPNGLNNFTEITGPTRQDDLLTELYSVSGSYSVNVPQLICETFKKLSKIGLAQMSLERIDDYSFRSCKELTFIFLWGNNISYIDENAFSENPKLIQLALYENKLKTLPENLFLNQQKLESLSLENNPFTDIPKYLFKSLINLEVLYLKNDQIIDVKPEWFETLGLLRYLDLSYESNRIENLPSKVFEPLKSVTFIGLRDNKLTVIHADSFGILISAPKIDFYNNQINAIDIQFIFNTNASVIYMQKNVCANVSINDSSTSKNLMKTGFRKCFDNYKALGQTSTIPTTVTTISSTTSRSTTVIPSTSTSSSCSSDNWTTRICTIEDNIDEFENNFEEFGENIINLSTDQEKIKVILKEHLNLILENQNKIASLEAIIAGLQEELSNNKGTSN
ncbi:hypothetical protein ACKWTF_001533 [Chironomus riparius]